MGIIGDIKGDCNRQCCIWRTCFNVCKDKTSRTKLMCTVLQDMNATYVKHSIGIMSSIERLKAEGYANRCIMYTVA